MSSIDSYALIIASMFCLTMTTLGVVTFGLVALSLKLREIERNLND